MLLLALLVALLLLLEATAGCVLRQIQEIALHAPLEHLSLEFEHLYANDLLALFRPIRMMKGEICFR